MRITETKRKDIQFLRGSIVKLHFLGSLVRLPDKFLGHRGMRTLSLQLEKKNSVSNLFYFNSFSLFPVEYSIDFLFDTRSNV